MKNKKGFTLIELLAVIVVLAIVMVLATTTVLPYMANARKDAFVNDVNAAIGAASNAVSLISVGTISTADAAAYKTDTGYCFDLSDLKDLGLIDIELPSTTSGKVEVTSPTGTSKVFTYNTTMTTDTYSISDFDKTNLSNDNTAITDGLGTEVSCS